ncbi:MAG: isoleucine--tRNA ligase [Gammaproteobacteria bacterium]|nr:isoleucine--tRNA ligase [Gammaproteobacteria bacterium]
MTDYKNTLNLPETEFPMKANLSQREPQLLEKWEKIDLYQKMREQGKKRKKFILHDGPPYANGQIHVGHAVNKVLKDVMIKSRALSGFDTPYVPGWDCHGLPIEHKVEQKTGKAGLKISASEFCAECRAYANSQIDLQRDAFIRLGVLGDWQHPYTTMDAKFEADIMRSFAKIMEQGYVQQGYKPVYWCLDCASALAEAEIEYADKTSPAIDVRYRIIDPADFIKRFRVSKKIAQIYIPIWTTTPWTLPASQAVALHPEILYALVQVGNEALLIAQPLLEAVMQRYGVTNFDLLTEIHGKDLENISLEHPFYERVLPVVLGEHVTVEAGTGAVHTAPAHGVDDYAMGQKYNLPLDNPVADSGCFHDSVSLVAGLHVNKANAVILTELENRGVLLHQAKISHSYPHCWRHKTPLIFRATPQWFISMEKNQLRKNALAATKEVKWMPASGENRMRAMLENRPDWCISRQRTWGVPIPLFLHKETALPHPDSQKLMKKIADLVEKNHMEAWHNLDIKEWLGKDAEHYVKSKDVLDVWFDSGVTHQAVLRRNPDLAFPADMYLEGSDQHRGWFQTALLTSMAMNQCAPYKTVLTHGIVVDPQGRKMSKSLGNVIAPEKIIDTLGADVLRLWVAATDYRTEMAISDEILKRNSETYRRIRNTARFLLANLSGFDPKQNLVPTKKMLALDRWIVDRARVLQNEIIAAYESGQLHVVVQKMHHFCAIDLGSFYLDVIKDRQYTTPANSLARRSAQTAIYHLAEALVRWLAPILTFTAEEIWQYMPGERVESVFLETWYEELPELTDQTMDQNFWETIRLVRDEANREIEMQRKAGVLGSALEAHVQLFCDPTLKETLEALSDELRFVLITSRADVLPLSDQMSDAVETSVPGLKLRVTALTDPKCTRCWHRRADVGMVREHPEICERCATNITTEGEERYYA